MVSEALFELTVAFSLAAGSAAGLLSVLTWEALRRSPFGRAVFVLSLVLVLFTAYHGVVLVAPPAPGLLAAVKSAMFSGVAVFIWLLVWSQRRLRAEPRPGGVD